MPDANIKELMAAAVAETFENMAFLAVEPQPEGDTVNPDDTWCWARIELRKPAMGWLVFQCPHDLAADITEVVFGPAKEITDSTVTDALAELSNTIAGRCMSAMLPQDTAFELGLPQTGRGEAATSNGAQHCPCVTEDGRALWISLENAS